MRIALQSILSSAMAGTLLLALNAPAAQTNKPNVVFILVDDMGYADTSCYQTFTNPVVVTTNIDRLASQGLRFTQYYVASPICSPSRTALISGSYPGRWRITSFINNKTANRNRNMADFADPQVPTTARAFKAAGYAVGHFGKWHMGAGRNVDDAPLPEAYGYDDSLVAFEGLGNRLGYNEESLSTASALLQQGVLTWMPKAEASTNQVNAAINFLAAHTNQPCYVDLWFNDVHTGWYPAPGSWQKYAVYTTNVDEQKFYAVLANVDVQVGRFLTALDNLGLATNTIIVYSADNGAPGGNGSAAFSLARNGGLRGKKGSLYEGGIREPFIVRWPGHIPSGRTNTQTVLEAVDLMPTLCALTQVALPSNYLPDGEDMSQAWLGQAQTRTKPLYWWFINDAGPANGTYDHAPPLALRVGNWKVLTDYTKSVLELYNLGTDPFETTNAAASQSALANSMADQLISWWQTMPK
jgi:arylsulfatase A-like enzyme